MGVLDFIKLEVGRRLAPRWSRKALPQVDGSIECADLEGDVQVRRDEYGVPHITTSTLADLAFAQGFVQAQDRMWQMELGRRLGHGRLSEVLGESAIEIDKFARIVGWARCAEKDWKDIQEKGDKTVISMYTAYANGVNHFLSRRKPTQPSVEFKLLNYFPDPWTELDTLVMQRLLCYRMSYGWEHELVRLKLIRLVGAENARFWDISDEKTPPIVPHEDLKSLDLDSVLSADKLGPEAAALGMCTGQGSNSWSVHGSRTASGNTILCNDPHLQLAIPNTLYENHCLVKGADGEVILHINGVALPGVPLCVIMHNEDTAIGITLGYSDVQDLYVERFEDDKSLRYEVDTVGGGDDEKGGGGEPVYEEAEVITEKIPVKGRAEPVAFGIMKTRHGTIISDSKLVDSLSGATLNHYETDSKASAEPADSEAKPKEKADSKASEEKSVAANGDADQQPAASTDAEAEPKEKADSKPSADESAAATEDVDQPAAASADAEADSEVEPKEKADSKASAAEADAEAKPKEKEDLKLEKKKKKLRIALASALTVPGLDIIGVFLKLGKAKNYDDYKEAVEGIAAPPLNITYADKHGDMGYYLSGSIPIRPEGNKGLVPAPGWNRKNDWGPRVPFEQMPHSRNPEKGYVVSCNQRSVDKDYPYDLGQIYRQGYRARRCDQYLASKDKLTIDDCKELQQDVYDVVAEDFFALFDKLGVTVPSGADSKESKNGEEKASDANANADAKEKIELELHSDLAGIWRIMRKWDLELTTDCVGGTIFHTLLNRLLYQLLRNGLKKGSAEGHGEKELTDEKLEEFINYLLGDSVVPTVTPIGTSYKCRPEMSVFRMLDEPEGWWVTQSGGIKQLMSAAFTSTCDILMKRLGSNPNKWRWGEIHKLRLDHPFTPKFGPRPFSRGPVEVPGSSTTVWLMNASRNEDKYPNCDGGPVYRQIIDLGDVKNSYTVLCCGQSGHIASEHYNDQTEMLLQGKYKQMLWTDEDVAKHTKHTLTLKSKVAAASPDEEAKEEEPAAAKEEAKSKESAEAAKTEPKEVEKEEKPAVAKTEPEEVEKEEQPAVATKEADEKEKDTAESNAPKETPAEEEAVQ